jgi:hypothetical protein
MDSCTHTGVGPARDPAWAGRRGRRTLQRPAEGGAEQRVGGDVGLASACMNEVKEGGGEEGHSVWCAAGAAAWTSLSRYHGVMLVYLLQMPPQSCIPAGAPALSST